MPARHLPTAATLLDALEGIAYLLGRDGAILALGQRNWTAFARENGGNPRVLATAPGDNLFDAIRGEEVRRATRLHLAALFERRHAEIVIACRCDSPDIRRELRLAMRPVEEAGAVVAVLCQALTVSETLRPPLDLFSAEAMTAYLRETAHLPIVRMCSYCHRIALPREAPREWVEADEYYRRGGGAAVRISHGICPACHESWVRPFLPPAGGIAQR